MPQTNHRLQWSAPEFNYYSKGRNWIIVSGVVAVVLLLPAIWTANFLFCLLIVLSYFSLMAYAFKKPRQIEIAITPRGVKTAGNFYQFDALKSFWIFYEPPELKEISLLSKKLTSSHIRIPLGEQNPVEARSVLIRYIPEKKQEESLIDILARNVGF